MDVVIDTNYLRKQDLEGRLQSSASQDRYIITDTALLETLKNEHWELTARKSFAIIAKYPDKIWLAYAPCDLYRGELNTGTSATQVIDEELVTNFRLLLNEIQNGFSGPGIDFLRGNISAAQASLSMQQQNHARNFEGLRLAYNDIKQTLNLKNYRKRNAECPLTTSIVQSAST